MTQPAQFDSAIARQTSAVATLQGDAARPARAARLQVPKRPVHHFSVDVEEHFQVSALEPHVPRSQWHAMESRVDANVERLLELLGCAGHTATFFVLGWIAEKHPRMVRSIADAGHEVASHGWDHRRVTTLMPEEFRSSVRRSRELLEDVSGQRVIGFRAPSFSIVPGREWALEVLVEEGYRYDSSLVPIRRRGYGYAGAPQDPYWIECPSGQLAEVPPATLRAGGVNLPAGGGAYFRLFPFQLVASALRSCERRGMPGTFYIHPWEIDPAQPRVRAPWPTRVRHYGGLHHTLERLQRLLREFRFQAITRSLHRS